MIHDLNKIYPKNVILTAGGDQTLNFTKFSCPCGKEYYLNDLKEACFLYGVFILDGSKKGYIGTTCLNTKCHKNITLCGDKERYSALVNCIFKQETKLKSLSVEPKYSYFSNIIHKPSQIEEISQEKIQYFWGVPRTDGTQSRYFNELQNHIKQNKLSKPKYFSTFPIEKDLIESDFILSIWWVAEDQIEKFISLENSKGLRIFPRFIHYDWLHRAIDQYALGYFYGLDGLDPQEYIPIAPISLVHKKEVLNKRIQFLNILACKPLPIPKGSVPYVINDDNFSQTALDFNRVFKGTNHELEHHSYYEIEEKIWDNIHKDYMRDILDGLDSAFLREYESLCKKIDFSFDKFWRLKDNYLLKLYDSIESRYRRQSVKQESKNAQIKQMEQLDSEYPELGKFISQDPQILELKKQVIRLARNTHKDIRILITGESGTGKELIAKAIHQLSDRKNKKFISVNCGALSEQLILSELFGHVKGAFTGAERNKIGRFMEADKGTIFLDEIGDLTLENQVKLFRTIEYREVQQMGSDDPKEITNARMIFATNQNLQEMVGEGKFRKELYSRINIAPLPLPALKERKDDIPELVRHFVNKFDDERNKDPSLEKIKINDEVLDILKDYSWPANVRDLRNLILRIMSLRDINDRSELSLNDIPADFFDNISVAPGPKSKPEKKKYPGNMKATDKEIIDCMKKNNNNKSQTARDLKMDVRQIRKRWNEEIEPRFK